MAGAIPLLRPLRESLAGDQMRRVVGIVNGTTNYILSRMAETGAGFAEALAEATELGYAEADPTADVDGFDAAAKAAILAVAGLPHPGHRRRRATARASPRSPRPTSPRAAEIGCTVKLLAICERVRQRGRRFGGRSRAPRDDPDDPPAGAVGGAFNAVFVEAEAAGQLMFYGQGAGGEPPPARCWATWWRSPATGSPAGPGRARPATPTCGPADGRDADPVLREPRRRRQAGVLATVAQAFADARREHRDGAPGGPRRRRDPGDRHPQAPEAALSAMVAALRDMAVVRDVTSVLRVEGDCSDQPAWTRHALAGAHRGLPRPAARQRRDSGRDAAGGRHPAGPAPELSRAHGLRGLPQGRGRQPHRLLQGPRHDDGHHQGRRGGREGGHLRLDRQHQRQRRGLRRARRDHLRRPRAAGQDRARQARPGAGARREAAAGPGQLRRLPGAGPQAGRSTTRSAWSTASTRSASRGRRPRPSRSSTCSATPPTSTASRSATPATSPPTGRATASTPPTGPPAARPRMWGFQAAGAAPIVTGARSSSTRTTIATAIRIGNPASWTQGDRRPRRVRRAHRRRHRPGDPRRLPAARPQRGRLRRAGVRRLGRRPAAGRAAGRARPRPAGRLHRHRQRAQGPGVGDLRRAGTRDHPGRRRARLPRSSVCRRRRDLTGVRVRVPATSANLGPAFDCAGLALTQYDVVDFAVVVRAVGRGRRRRCGRAAHRRVAPRRPRVPRRLRRARLDAARACAWSRATASRRGGGWAPRPPRSSPASRRLGPLPGRRRHRRQRRAPARDRDRGHADNVAACLHGGRHARRGWTTRACAPSGSTSTTRSSPSSWCPDTSCPRTSRAGCCRTSCRTPTRRSTPAARHCWCTRSPPSRRCCSTPPRTGCTSGSAAPRCRSRSALIDRLREAGHAAVVSGAGPSVLVLGRATPAAGRRSPPRARRGGPPSPWRSISRGTRCWPRMR